MAVRAVLKQPEKNAQRDPGENGWACNYCGKEGHSPYPFWCLCQELSQSLFTLIKLYYTKALEWSSLVPGPEVKSSEITNPTLFTVSYHYDPADAGNFISGSSAFSISSLNFWKFLVHVLLKSYCCSVTQSFLTLQPHGLQHARLPCPSLSPRACSNSCPLSRWCHPTISSSVVPFSCLRFFFPSIRVFSNKLALCIRWWPKYWSFSICPSNEYSGLISFRIDSQF